MWPRGEAERRRGPDCGRRWHQGNATVEPLRAEPRRLRKGQTPHCDGPAQTGRGDSRHNQYGHLTQTLLLCGEEKKLATGWRGNHTQETMFLFNGKNNNLHAGGNSVKKTDDTGRRGNAAEQCP